MSKLVTSHEKPLSHLNLPDWYAAQWELRQNADVRRSEACQLRNSSTTIRSEGNARTKWDTYINNIQLMDRITEISKWKDIFEDLSQNLLNEIRSLGDEKAIVEKEIENISYPMQLVSECISKRDGRRETELTYDEADIELKKELCILENLHEDMTKRVQAALEKLKNLESISFELSLNIEDKDETIKIDKENLELGPACPNISFKPKTLVPEKNKSISYETWLEQCRMNKIFIDCELRDCYTFRESLHIAKEHAWNDIRAQQDITDYALRKRIYQTQKAKNELEWQKLKVQREMEMLKKDISESERALINKMNTVKCVETRLENRIFRPGTELCKDKVELGLKNEITQLEQTEKDLVDIIECTRTSYNNLESLLIRIVRNLEDKQHSLNTDMMCLDMRGTKTGENGYNETDRNIVLTRLEDEIPKEF